MQKTRRQKKILRTKCENKVTSAKVAFFPSTWYLLWLFEYAVRVTTRPVPGTCTRTVKETQGTKCKMQEQANMSFEQIDVIPMTMGTRCCKVFFPNYSKKQSAEDTLVPTMGKTGKHVCFFWIICSRCCTRRNLRFHAENCQHADQEQLTRR